MNENFQDVKCLKLASGVGEMTYVFKGSSISSTSPGGGRTYQMKDPRGRTDRQLPHFSQCTLQRAKLLMPGGIRSKQERMWTSASGTNMDHLHKSCLDHVVQLPQITNFGKMKTQHGPTTNHSPKDYP